MTLHNMVFIFLCTKYCFKYWWKYRSYISLQILVKVLSLLFSWSIGIGIDYTFKKYC